MPNVIEAFSNARLTQGVIFTCAKAEGYEGCEVSGLIITARCDAAQDKTAIYNYVPVVRLEDWLRRDFRIITCEREQKNVHGNLRQVLKSAGYTPAILDIHRPRAVLDTLFPIDHHQMAIRKARKSFEKSVAQFELLEDALSSTPATVDLPKLHQQFSGTHMAVLRECITQQLSGYYFLESISPNDKDAAGFVVLLREIHHLPKELAGEVPGGIDQNAYEEVCNITELARGKLEFTSADFCLPLGRVRSPEIEHLMQAFALLFTRVGIADPDPTLLDRFPARYLVTREPA
ncbi:hypothetical protein [Longimicrobium sp.]|uniref:hypothetical protein n=1 Tax=Longimicrobium sp. TaxID=2029185 RepID=UPI002B7B44DE|nr:hypothetical protein [Longimicrobium sp.]HSU15880.1 hypothetical protein [Longimicrobium sp.]